MEGKGNTGERKKGRRRGSEAAKGQREKGWMGLNGPEWARVKKSDCGDQSEFPSGRFSIVCPRTWPDWDLYSMLVYSTPSVHSTPYPASLVFIPSLSVCSISSVYSVSSVAYSVLSSCQFYPVHVLLQNVGHSGVQQCVSIPSPGCGGTIQDFCRGHVKHIMRGRMHDKS